MAVMRPVGNGHQLPSHARVLEESDAYEIDLDVSDFTKGELVVEVLGPRLTVRGNQLPSAADESAPPRLHERIEESFRLPDDAVADQIKVFYKHGTLEIHAPRVKLVPRLVPIEHRAFSINPDAEPC
jgi:HSP20 family molecular chaperone IbpA